MKPVTKKQLRLKREQIANLSTTAMQQIAGGKYPFTYGCLSDTRHCQPTQGCTVSLFNCD